MVTNPTWALITEIIFIVISVTDTKGDKSCGQVNLIATTSPQEITSPGYPDGYENNITCRWHIQTQHREMIKIEVVESDLYNPRFGRYRFRCFGLTRVEIYDGIPSGELLYSFCGEETSKYLSKSQSATIVFYSKDSGNGKKGFKLKYYEDDYPRKIFATEELKAGTRIKSFSPPSYGYTKYKFVQMSWRIESPKNEGELYIKTIRSNLKELGCGKGSNSMLAFDGYDNSSELLGDWCEDELLEITASGKYIFIVLNAKPFNNVEFAVKYGVNEEDEESTGSSSLGVGGITGISIGVIVALGLTYIIGKILCDRYSDRCDEDSNISDNDNPASRQNLFEDERTGQAHSTIVPASSGLSPSAPPVENEVIFPPPPSYEEVIQMSK